MRDMRTDLPDLQSSSQPVPSLRLLPCFLFAVPCSRLVSSLFFSLLSVLSGPRVYTA